VSNCTDHTDSGLQNLLKLTKLQVRESTINAPALSSPPSVQIMSAASTFSLLF
jgi:hypothetical protein